MAPGSELHLSLAAREMMAAMALARASRQSRERAESTEVFQVGGGRWEERVDERVDEGVDEGVDERVEKRIDEGVERLRVVLLDISQKACQS